MKRFFVLILVVSGGFAAWQAPAWNKARQQLAVAEARVAEIAGKGPNSLDLTDLQALRRLPRNIGEADLVNLTLRGTDIEDISGVEALPNLERLDMNLTRVRDLTPLANHPSLELVYMHGVWARDLSPLATIPTLERLDIGRTQVATLEPVTRIPRLNWLNLHQGYALDGSSQYYQVLAERLPELSGGRAYREGYRPDWIYQSKVRYWRLREWLGVPAERAV